MVARGANGRWEGSGSGLDEWAVAATAYAPAPSDADGPAPMHYSTGTDTRWDCNGGSPDGDGVRQWELVGGAPGFPLAVFFHGWEGGRIQGDHKRLIDEIRETETGPVTFSLYYTEYERPEIRKWFTEALSKHGLKSNMEKAYTAEQADLPQKAA